MIVVEELDISFEFEVHALVGAEGDLRIDEMAVKVVCLGVRSKAIIFCMKNTVVEIAKLCFDHVVDVKLSGA